MIKLTKHFIHTNVQGRDYMRYIGTFYNEIASYYSQIQWQEHGLDFEYIDRKKLIKNQALELLITGTITEEELSCYPNLRYIIVPYTGLNGLPLDLLKEKNIEVLNTSAHGHFVAERALALTLAVMGEIVHTHNRMLTGDWSRRTEPDRLFWNSLFHKKVGIFGYGVIGQTFHSLIEPFQCEVGILRYKDRTYDRDLKQFDTLKKLVAWCDVLVISAPLTESTEGAVNSKVLELMTDKVLINVGRGKIINEAALYNALDRGTLKGFASDVWYQYPNKKEPVIQPSKYDLTRFTHVVMTPHNAGFEKTATDIRYEDVFEKIKALML